MKQKKSKKKSTKKINKLERLLLALIILFALYDIVIDANNSQIQTKTLSDNKIYQETQKPAREPKNSKIESVTIEEVKKDIPVCSNSKSKTYMDYKKITDTSSKQWHYINESGKIKIENGFLMEGDYIGVALGSYFGEIGTKYIFTLDTGKQIKVVKVEEKADIHTNNGCQQKWDKSVIEFVIDSDMFEKSANGYVYSGNFNNVEQFNGHIEKIEMVIKEEIVKK